jgi:hypothetical protein
MYLLGLKYLEALPHVAQGKGSTIFLPAEATGVLGALGGMKELLAKAGNAAQGAPGTTREPGSPPPGGYQPPRPSARATLRNPDEER